MCGGAEVIDKKENLGKKMKEGGEEDQMKNQAKKLK